MAIKALNTKSLNIAPVDVNSATFKSLNMAASVNMGLPEKFTIPQSPDFAVMTFNNLLDPNNGNKPRQGIGVEIHLPDNSTKVVTVSSLSRKFFNEAVSIGDTRGKTQKAVIDVFQDVNTMQLSPSEQVALLAGKTIEKEAQNVTVWVAEFKDGEIQGYTETEKATYIAK